MRQSVNYFSDGLEGSLLWIWPGGPARKSLENVGKWVQDVVRWQGVVCQWGWGVLECLIQVMMEGKKLLEATLPQQVRTNRSSPGDGQLDRKRESCTAFCLPFFLLVSHISRSLNFSKLNPLWHTVQLKKSHGPWAICRYSEDEQDL